MCRQYKIKRRNVCRRGSTDRYGIVHRENKEYDKEEIVKNIQEKIHNKNSKYYAVIKVETSYI